MTSRSARTLLHLTWTTYAVMPVAVASVVQRDEQQHTKLEVQDQSMVCVYPISGQYSTLSRFLFYGLIVFAVLGQRWVWPSIAALAYVLNYSATAVVHMCVIIFASTDASVNLDIYGIFAVLSVSTTLISPAAILSKRLRSSKYRSMFGWWAVLVSSTAVYDLIPLLSRSDVLERPCYSKPSQGNELILLTRPSQLLVPNAFECTYACFSVSQPLRKLDDVIAFDSGRLYSFEIFRIFSYISILLSSFIHMSMACSLFNSRRKTHKSYLKDIRETGVWVLWTYANIPGAIILVVVNEIYLLKTAKLPVSEKSFEVGQWATFVTIAFALVAGGINESGEKEKEEAGEQSEEEGTSMIAPPYSPRAGAATHDSTV